MDTATADKRAVRARMRRLRRELDDQAGRSARIWGLVTALDEVRRAATVMLFDSVAGEPDTSALAAWCRNRDKSVVHPEDEPAPSVPDVVIVPGLAFTADGHRLGQGGGWYDRFLPDVRSDCLTIGVGFGPQVLDELPIEPHDVVLDLVITDEGVLRR